MSAGPYEPPKSVVRDAPAEPVERPRQVGLAAKCLWASIGIGGILLVLDYRFIAGASSAATAWIVPAAVLGVLALFTAAISAGRNWARIVFLVLFVIGALPYFAVLAEMFARSKLTASLSVIQLLLQAAAMYLVFTKPGSAWFRRQA